MEVSDPEKRPDKISKKTTTTIEKKIFSSIL
jgi:hypothetical protein